jgi:1,4-alpha-glucan branching enzyme/maltooligosyltrehalose trehalohydrolase
MSFGAECLEDGSVRFRLWAPAAERVGLCVAGSEVRLPLERLQQGWFEVVTDVAKAGSLYKFQIDGGEEVPDPASRFQPGDVHGPSQVVDPYAFDWQDGDWRGRRWEEAVIYELHVGAFTPAGTFSAANQRLDYLADLGITAVELMPLSDFPGKRNWGYDGVLPFAPDSTYGQPEDLKELIHSAHARGMMVFLDVVYNHLGPEGNYLNVYAPQFFTARHKTPWGNAINFDGREARAVRDFFIQNALYWLTEYHFDGLRLDAVHSIVDDSIPHLLDELAETVRGAIPDRQIHLVLENERNQSTYLRRKEQCRPAKYNAQWNDDIHHTLHVLTTGEQDGYYSDYAAHPLEQLGRCLTSGFAYQGDVSLYGNGERRGESTAGLPLTAFVSFLQNHDQIGNRAFGERIATIAKAEAIRLATEILLLAPSIPLLFMGEEFGATTPFLFFCNFEKDLAEAVSAGRRNEFARFLRFNDSGSREGIPDPNAESTYEHSKLDWEAQAQPNHQDWLRLHRELMANRRKHIWPRPLGDCKAKAKYEVLKKQGLKALWEFSDGAQLTLLANFGDSCLSGAAPPSSKMIYASEGAKDAISKSDLPAWSVAWFLRA